MAFLQTDDDRVTLEDLSSRSDYASSDAVAELRGRGDQEVSRVVNGLIRSLENPKMAYEAAQALGAIGDPRAVGPLIMLLKHKEWNIRGVAAESLGLIKDPTAVDPLISCYSEEVEAQAGGSEFEALQSIGGNEATAFLNKTRDEEFASELDRIGKGAARPALVIDSILRDKRFRDFFEAFRHKYDQKVVVEYLYEFAKSKISLAYREDRQKADLLKRTQAAREIGLLGDKRGAQLLLEQARVFTNNFNERCPDQVLLETQDGPCTLHPGEYGPLVGEIAFALGESKDKSAVKPLKRLLMQESTYDTVGYRIAEALWRIEGTAEYLIHVLNKDQSHTARSAAAKRLGEIGDKRALDSLVAALKLNTVSGLGEYTSASTLWQVRHAAASALGALADDRAVTPLIAALKDEDHFTRIASARALVGIAHSRVVESLAAALTTEKNDFVKENFIKLLGMQGNRAAEPALMAALKDGNIRVRVYARRALKKIRGE